MQFNPCFVIPIFNHHATIGSTVDRLTQYQLPIFIVDDGSSAETQAVLTALATRCHSICLLRLPVNAGKGAAVIHGMLQAYQAGYSHALQIDADGQHHIPDAARFLAEGALHPDSVICGQPIYDDTVPKGRLYGRYVTHFWVWVETLSFAIKDSMCGFRLYPLAMSCALINDVELPKRMDFDTAIVVRLAWRGAQFINIPTRVIYPENGLSHFNMWHDNIRITKMHTRLCCGMLLRLPCLLWKKIFKRQPTTQQHWSKREERGSSLALRSLVMIYRLLGKRVARMLLYPVVAYFYLTGSKARRASQAYLKRMYALGAVPDAGGLMSFKHMLTFAQSGLDKLSAWVGHMADETIDFPNRTALEQVLTSGKGALLIGSHLGNIEMSRALAAQRPGTVINAVVYTDHAQRFNQMLTEANAEFKINLVEVSNFGVDTAILFQEKIDRGELIVIVGDRTPPAENGRVSYVDFLGSPAPFAQGPMILASLLGCPVYLLFCLREHSGYRTYFEHFADRVQLPRQTREASLQLYIQQYAQKLEAYCVKAPLQWFNFYDFWQK